MSAAPVHPIEVIERKRDGGELSDEQIRGFIAGVVAGSVTDAQASTLLMAIFLRGLNPRELATLTEAMRTSGEVFDSSPLGKVAADKHSTGGVGDKTSLLVAPIAAAAGLAVPMISGRSLGHTGGTLDKLESIPGYNTRLTLAEFAAVVERCGASIIGQTERLVPADRILYALRDHTGTVASPYLICASIMSKKLAAGLNALVLDVKTGSGAFLKREEDAEFLAHLMVETGHRAGTPTVALLTRMDQPLGRFAGNWLEVWECADILQGRVHPRSRDLVDLSLVLAGWMIFLGGKAASAEEGRSMAETMLQNGEAWRALQCMVQAQGGDVQVLVRPGECHRPAASRVVAAANGGFVQAMDTTAIGWAVQRLGAGRTVPGGPVAMHAGIEMHTALGEHVSAGQPLVTLFAEDAALLGEPEAMVRLAIRIGQVQPERRHIVQKILTPESLHA